MELGADGLCGADVLGCALTVGAAGEQFVAVGVVKAFVAAVP
jgi:hypothetical protein